MSPQKNNSVLNCVGPDVVDNEYLVTVNDDDKSTKEGILKTLKLIDNKGFDINNLLVFGEQPQRTFLVKFNPDSFENEEKASEAREDILSQILEIDGNRIECNGRVTTQAVGEEGGKHPVTTLALGEEGSESPVGSGDPFTQS